MQIALRKCYALCIVSAMRTHKMIIAEAGGPTAVHERLGLAAHEIHAVRSWSQREKIPPEHWTAFVDAGIATLEELAEAAAARRAGPSQVAA